MDIEVLIALIGLGGLIWSTTVGLWYAQYNKHKLKLQKLKDEQCFEKQSINTLVNLQEWDTLNAKVQTFCAESGINRFLVLVCVNGLSDPKEVTAIYQYRVDTKDFRSYVNLPLDADYVARINQLKAHGSADITVSELPPSLIRDIYESEGVTHAYWYMIDTMESAVTDQVAYKYCSFATHGEAVSEETLQKISNIVGELKKIIIL